MDARAGLTAAAEGGGSEEPTRCVRARPPSFPSRSHYRHRHYVSLSASDTPLHRPPTLPSQEFRPKQSLGQNFLSDQNYVLKICNSLVDDSPGGRQVVELGPGPGALTRVLFRRYPEMLCVEIDPRAVALLGGAMPALTVVQSDVLQVDWTALAELRGGPLSVIGNLPYHITSQILFCLLDNHRAVRQAVVTMQLEVAQRIIAPPRCKDYGILSVLFQLYTRPKISFKLPPTVFYPQPKVTSALVTLDFLQPGEGDGGVLLGVDPGALKQVLSLSFQQRRKMLRQSLKGLLAQRGLPPLPEEWATRRPEELEPREFVELTRLLFGTAGAAASGGADDSGGTRVWRRARHGGADDEEEGEEEE